MKINQILSIFPGLKHSLWFLELFNWEFLVIMGVKCLYFKASCCKFLVQVATDESSTHNKVQFGDCLIKITLILNILQGL